MREILEGNDDAKKYSSSKGLPFKVLLLIDNALGHPQDLEYENVKIVQMAHSLGGEGFDDFTDGDIAKLMADKELSEDDLFNLVCEITEMEDQQICIKFCVKNGFKGAEIFWMLQTAYGDAVLSRRRVFEWYKRFKEGREETADNERSGRPSTSTTPEKVDKVLELVREVRRITVREVAEEAGISFGSTQSIMKDILGVRRLNAVLVPKDLTFDQKNARKETASLNLKATTDGPELLKRVITGDETWIYGFDSETTQQASEWRFKNEPRPKKARKAPSKVKVMLTVFFDYQGIVHHEFQQQGSTITADSYLVVLRRLREAIRQKRPGTGEEQVVDPPPR
ncbi:hypothetical protein LAZ67_1007019 [Cordylochernes scorpioides]|uniref:Mos1 transposase HTH domain-containing protein n=1 Tax=Cordylochernes scorpioides TaxID=51811 RepID=A0ABY6K051_9ARAC|nr:hypothetical protein LAZ67_1007019 [Cordylochernes scorpioides]